MPKTVRFLTECAGRNKGVVETIYDDTLADAWIDARLAEVVEGSVQEQPKKDDEKAEARSPKGPPVDRMVKRPGRKQ